MKVTSLTPVERLQLRNQFRILEEMDPHEAKFYAKAKEIFEHGYSLLYDEVFEILPEEMSIQDCKYVYEVLGMFSTLQHSYDDLVDKQGLTTSDVHFSGFDGNNEGDQYGFVRFLRDQGIWEAPPLNTKGDLNSHHQTASRYRTMLDRWQHIPDDQRETLTAAQIKDIIAR